MPKESLYTGEKITIYYKIINKSILDIPYLEIQNNISKQLTGMNSPVVAITLKAKETYYHKEDIILKRRGFYELGEIEITVRDIFGIYSLQRKYRSCSSKRSRGEIPNTKNRLLALLTALKHSSLFPILLSKILSAIKIP